jgi:flagellar protein FliJ
MKRSERMAPVQRVLGSNERDRARDLGAAQKTLAEAETRLQDLRQYREDYLNNFQQRARAGNSAMALRDFQLFLARLEEAVKQQEQIVAQARDALAGSKQRWQGAARQVKAVESVVGKWQTDERRRADQHEQKETDERAQRRRAPDGSQNPEQS